MLHTAPAEAAPRTWVSSAGTDAGACPRTAPCATFNFAHGVTDAGGEINCVDAADYGAIGITKAISIICDNTKPGTLIAGGGIGVAINAGPTDIVTLKGLNIEGTGNGVNGISFNTGGALHLHKVQIRNFRFSSVGTAGLYFQPDGYAELYVADSYITDNAGTSQTAGIVIRPRTSASVNAFINRVQLENNSVGVLVDGSNSTGVAVNAIVLESMVVGSAGTGIAALTTASHAAVSVLVDHTVVSGNFASGINANGAAASGAGSAVVRIGDSTIALNVTGVGTTGAGVVQSFKNNRISGNLTDGTPITAFPGPGGPLQ